MTYAASGDDARAVIRNTLERTAEDTDAAEVVQTLLLDLENALMLNTDTLSEVLGELARQHGRWGEQNHPDGTGEYRRFLRNQNLPTYGMHALLSQNLTDRAAAAGDVTWDLILLEEVFEALAEHNPKALRVELVQVAAVAVQWIGAIDRRAGQDGAL